MNMRRIAGLALVTSTLLTGQSEGMTLDQFKAHTHEARVYMVLGALSVTNAVNIVCPVQVTVAELEAALTYRVLPASDNWVLTMIHLMDERGCKGEEVKPDA